MTFRHTTATLNFRVAKNRDGKRSNDNNGEDDNSEGGDNGCRC